MIGCGAMGSAFYDNWRYDHELLVIDPKKDNALKSVNDLDQNYRPDIILIAIKPQLIPSVLPDYKKFDAIFISIAAGIKISVYENILGLNSKIIRVMPNLAVKYKSGVSAYFQNNNCTEHDTKKLSYLFANLGLLEKLSIEDLFDVVTALSGSGIAYVFYLIECLNQNAIKFGLSPETAQNFATQTIVGAGDMLKYSNLPADILRNQVTSEKGTTDAALKILMNPKALSKIIEHAMQAAIDRSKELSNL